MLGSAFSRFGIWKLATVASTLLVGVAIGIGFMQARIARSDDGPPSPSAHAGPSPADAIAATPEHLQDALATARDSVYLIVSKSGDSFAPLGTAWSVGPRQLATNAHVAESIDEALDDKSPVFARWTSDPPVDIPVLSATPHPGYRAWTRLTDTLEQSRRELWESSPQLVPACDVALVTVDGAVGPPLRIAPRNEILNLRPGDTVAYIGYPGEGVAGDPENPPAHVAFGHIMATSTFFGRQASPEASFLVHHDLVSRGGASGSPILNNAGHVVAVHSAASSLRAVGGRVSLGVNFGQRVDLLNELLDGGAEAAHARRDPEWRDRFAALLPRLESLLERAADHARVQAVYAGEVTQAASLHKVNEFRVNVPASGGAAPPIEVELKHGKRYVFVARTTDFSPTSLRLLRGKTVEANDEEWSASAALRVKPVRDGVRTLIAAAPMPVEPKCGIVVWVYELVSGK